MSTEASLLALARSCGLFAPQSFTTPEASGASFPAVDYPSPAPVDHDNLGKNNMPARKRFGALVQQRRGFPNGYWAVNNIDEAMDAMAACLDDLGLSSNFIYEMQAPLSENTTEWLKEFDEEDTRRLQIEAILAMSNTRLTSARATVSFIQYEEPILGWDEDEPVWVLATGEEHIFLQTMGWRVVELA